jgi:pyruvate dehydrogenase E2 component (dihydrolipoamide acetyltransferase)
MSAIEVLVPDIGDFKDIPVIEVLAKAGGTVAKDDPLIVLESDKATMEVPSPTAGVVKDIRIKAGDRVSQGSLVLTLDALEAATAPAASATASSLPREGGRGVTEPETSPSETAPQPAPPAAPIPEATAGGHHAAGPESHPIAAPARIDEAGFQKAHASPAVRAFARELGVDLAKVGGTGPKERILREDVQNFVKQLISGAAITGAAAAGAITGGGALNLLPWPQVDFTKFGEIEVKPLGRIKKISGANLARNWVMIPHVTQHDDADITDLEALRVQLNKDNEKAGIKITMLAFLIKAVVHSLRKYPDFNASIEGDNVVLKKYVNVGFAADTPNGLVVPVIRNADKKGILEIAREMSALSAKAREGELGPADMQGGCFSISSLGGIGGTYFTPIINAPEVAILGVCRSQTRPVWDGRQFAPRLILPLSLSYDHRVIDGASAARFTTYLGSVLADFRRVLL